MKVYALTGGFLTGKSSCLELFREFGAEVCDVDSIYHKLLEESDELQTALKRELNISSTVNRDYLKLALKNKELSMERLSELTHPFIIRDLKKVIEKKRSEAANSLVLIEVPLLYECELESLFDKVIVVATGKSVLEKRSQERGYTKEQLEMILKSQLELTEKISRADIVIDNTGSFEQLHKEIKRIYNYLVNMPKEES